MSSKDTYERISIDIVAAAKATFAKGRRTEAIEMLRRFDLGRRGKAAVAEALQELMLEQQRLIEEERRRVRAGIDEHLNAAETLRANGHLPEAWARACDALHLDPNDQMAIALEAGIRTALDEQAGRGLLGESPKAPVDRGRETAREREEARHPNPDPVVPIGESPAMTSRSAWWVVAAVVVLAMLLTGLATRTC
jgi:hypothetical protein